MQSFTVTKDATSTIIPVSIYDSSSTTGAKLAGLVYNTSSLTAYYNRMGASGSAVAISLVTATKGTWVTSGFVAVDGSNMPGDYELHVPDAAFASGVNEVIIQLKGAANMVPVNICVHLRGVDHQDTVRAGMKSLPNVASGASGAILTQGTGTAQLDVSSGKVLLQATQSGVTIPTVTTVTTVTNLTNAPTNGDLTATMKTSVTTAATAATPTIANLGSGAKADVNAEVVDVVAVDTLSEMSAGAPPLLPTMRDVLNYQYRYRIRNTKKVDASTSPAVETIYADDTTTPLFKRSITDSANVATFAETVSG